MAKRNDRRDHFTPLQKALHWIIAFIVLTMIPMGLYMVKRYVETNFDAATAQIFGAHKLIGFVLLILVLIRIAVRIRHGAPLPSPTLSRMQQSVAATMHTLLYLLLLAVPVLGWLGASADGTRGILAGLELPEVLAHNDDLGWRILWWHGWVAIALGSLAVLHIGAALLHLLVLKDTVFQRMWRSRSDC